MKSAIITSLLFLAFLLFFLYILIPIRVVKSLDETKYLYVSHANENFITVIDPKSNKVIDTLNVGKSSTWAAVNHSKNILYTANFLTGFVTVYDITDRKVITTVPVGSHPSFVRLSPDGKYVLVSHESGSGIILINASNYNIEKRVNEGTGMFCFCDGGKRIFQPQIFTPYVLVFDAETFEVRQRIEVGGRPMHLAFTSDEKFAYIPNFDLNEVEKIETKTGNIVLRITGIRNPRGIAITPDGKWAYVTNVVDNTVTVIDLTNDTVSKIISVGQMPTTVAIPGDGKYAYVSDQGGSFIVVIDIATNEITTAIPVASNPISIVWE